MTFDVRALARGRRLVLGAALFAAIVAAGAAPARAEGAGGCEDGTVREGSECLHRLAAPGSCASADGGEAGGAGGEGGAAACGDGATGAASERFSPTDVAAEGEGGSRPPAPGPGPGPQPQPCDVGCGPPGGGPGGGGPTPTPSITVVESPAVPDLPPGLP